MGSYVGANLVNPPFHMVFYLRITLAFCLSLAAVSGEGLRSRTGLMALYDFNESQGTDIKDVAGVGAPLDLEIEKITQVTRQKGALKVTSSAMIKSKSLPFAECPAALDGSMAGDVGFDPLCFSADESKLFNYREAEIKHAVSANSLFVPVAHEICLFGYRNCI